MMKIAVSIMTRPAVWLLFALANPFHVMSQSSPVRLMGEVIAIDSAKGLDIRADSGGTGHIRIDERTRVVRIPPGETSLAKAEQIKPGEIGVGDRVFASGASTGNRAAVIATQVVVMSRSDIQKMREHENQEWRTRGIAGVVVAVNAQTKEITLLPRGRADAVPVIIAANDATRFRRYAVNSVRFSDAKASSLAEIKRGDHLRALGERSPDGARFRPDQVISGSFLTVVGVVSTVTPSGEIKVTVQGLAQPIVLRISADSTLRRITPKLAATLVSENSQAAARQSVANAAAASEGRDVLDRLAPMKFSELKQGDVVAFTSAAGGDLSRMTAVTLVGGLDVLIATLQKQAGGSAGPALNSGLPAGMNHANKGMPIGNLSSPLFGRSVGLASAGLFGANSSNRRIDLQITFAF